MNQSFISTMIPNENQPQEMGLTSDFSAVNLTSGATAARIMTVNGHK